MFYSRIKAFLIFLLLVISLSLSVSRIYAIETYYLVVEEGDWVEYEIVEIKGNTPIQQLSGFSKGDKVKLKIISLFRDPVYDSRVQRAHFNIYMHGETVPQATENSLFFNYYLPYSMISVFSPVSKDYWEKVDNSLMEYHSTRDYNLTYRIETGSGKINLQYNVTYITYHPDYANYPVEKINSNRINWVFNEDTGVLLNYEGYSTQDRNELWELEYRLIDTNIEHAMASGPLDYWSIATLILVGMFVILIFAVLLLMRKISALRSEIKDIRQRINEESE